MTMTSLEIVRQAGVVGPSTVAVWLANGRSPKWACVFGLLGEVFWFWEFYANKQYGLLILCAVFVAAWSRGLRTYWFKPEHA